VTDLVQENTALKDRVAMLEALIEQKKQNEAFTSVSFYLLLFMIALLIYYFCLTLYVSIPVLK
jgi:hypothetical protein